MILLRDLNPRQASGLFFVALAAGVSLIVADWASLWAWIILPVVPVVFYGIALWVSQAHFLVSHSSAVKSSPYILGFTLTLIALFNLFIRGGADLVDGTIDEDLFLGQVGAAVATTAVGLLARQILITHDVDEEEQHQVFRSIAGQLRKNARDFEMAQRQLVFLIQDFVAAREELFSKEEQAFEKFLSGLESGSQVLTEIETTYPKRLQSALDAVGEHLAELGKLVAKSAQSLRVLATTTNEGNNEIREGVSAIVNQLSESSGQWEKASSAAIGALDSSRCALQDRVSSLAELQQRFEGISASMDAATRSLEQLPLQASATIKNWDAQSKAHHEELAALYSTLLADAKAMDTVVGEVASLLSKRVADLKNERR